MSSVATCKLNSRYQTAVNNPRIYYGSGAIDGWGNTGHGLRDRKHVKDLLKIRSNSLLCCGMDELNFQELQKYWDRYKDDAEAFEALVAKTIETAPRNDVSDKRVLVVGIPTKVGGDSQYNLDFYNKLREVLESFGFIALSAPYKNKNSGNTIVAMAGQLP